MHEIGVVRSMVKTVTAFAEANQITDIAEIVVDVGELSLVIPTHAFLYQGRRALCRPQRRRVRQPTASRCR